VISIIIPVVILALVGLFIAGVKSDSTKGGEEMIKMESVQSATDFNKLTEDQLKDRYDAMVATEKERQIDRATNSLIKSLGWIIIPFPIFIFFQRKLRGKEAGNE
jgi:apolipoprotein N-acyltransferase